MLQLITVPPVYFWVEYFNEKPTIMTAAVQWKGMNFGLSFPADENVARRNMDKKKLVTHMKEVVSVLVLHGKSVLDSFNQIDPKLVNEQEARRWYFDPLWDKNVNAVNKLIKVKNIMRKDAVKLKLLDK
jgi:hypothetical protein